MIKNIFFPEKISNYYVFPKKIIGFDIGKNNVSATKLYLSGRNRIIEGSIIKNLESGTISNYPERVSNAIKFILKKFGKNNYICSAISSSSVIFKELTLPFTDPGKIKLIINFEMEPYLPFPSDEAILDFLIINRNIKEKKSTVLVTAIQKQKILEHINIFKNAGIEPNKITVDILDLYSIFKITPKYTSIEGDKVLLDLGFHSTRVAYLENNDFKLIRTIPRGIYEIAKNLGEKLNLSQMKSMEEIFRFGIENITNPDYTKAINEILNSFFSEIEFTIDSFREKLNSTKELKKILLAGGGIELKGLINLLESYLDIKCSPIELNEILKDESISTKIKNIPKSNILSLGTSLSDILEEDYNLLNDDINPTKNLIYSKQALTSISLSLIMITVLIVNSFLKINKLKSKTKEYSIQTIRLLRKNLKLPRDAKTLSEVVAASEAEVEKEENIWFAFSDQDRFSILKYLQELSLKIDRESLGLILEKLIITEDEINMYGKVKDYKSLSILENELKKSKLFSFVSTPQETEFEIKINIKKNNKLEV